MYSNSLESLLSSREERSLIQSIMLKTFCCVLQITLNVPGMPKRIHSDERAIIRAEELLKKIVLKNMAARLVLSNEAGLAVILGLTDVNPIELKRYSVSVEEFEPWCRVLDIDVILLGHQLSRSDIGLEPRLCLLCGKAAKECARLHSHPIRELRKRVRFLLSSLHS